MQVTFFVLCLVVGGCLALEYDEPVADEFTPLSDKELTEDLRQHKEETHPSFDEIKKKLEETGILRHDKVIGLFPRMFRGSNSSSNISSTARPFTTTSRVRRFTTRFRRRTRRFFTTPRPTRSQSGALCTESTQRPNAFDLGNHAWLLFHDFYCAGRRCGCSRGYGICRKTYTTIIIRALDYGRYYNKYIRQWLIGWYWYWKTHRIPSCCKCYSRFQ